MVAVKETLPACDIAMDDVTGEVCWVRIDTKDNPLYVGAFYRTPSDRSLYQLEQLDKSLDNIAKLTTLCLKKIHVTTSSTITWTVSVRL